MIWVLHSDIILGNLWLNILRNNAYKTSYIRKEEKWILLKGDRMVTEWSLKHTCHSVDWMVTERTLNGAFQFSRNGSVSSLAQPKCSLCLSSKSLCWDTKEYNLLVKNFRENSLYVIQCHIYEQMIILI